MHFIWTAKEALNTRNLKVQRGEVLPDRWQSPHLVHWLKERYGKDCVQRVADDFVFDSSAAPATHEKDPTVQPVGTPPPPRRRGRPRKAASVAAQGA